MNRSVRVAASGFWGLAICISFFYILGAYFSPPYQELQVSPRNFRVFLVSAAACILVGLGFGLWLTREQRKTKTKIRGQQAGKR